MRSKADISEYVVVRRSVPGITGAAVREAVS
jgi:hypothetical protein